MFAEIVKRIAGRLRRPSSDRRSDDCSPQAQAPSIKKSAATEKAWERGTRGNGMRRLGSGNYTGTFCKYCGDWIEDGEFYARHFGVHKAVPLSWNYENPELRRSGPDEIKPSHEEWLESWQAYGRSLIKSKCHWLSGNGPGIGPGDEQFRSEEEALATLSPYGMKTTWQDRMWSINDGPWHGGWSLTFSRKAVSPEMMLALGEVLEPEEHACGGT